MKDKTTIRSLRNWMQSGTQFPMLTCYDATTARLLAAASIPAMLVGDTAAQMILGYDSTLPVEMDFMVQITAAVKRGAPNAFIMADMPYGSYHINESESIRNSLRFIKEAGADSVKLEVGEHHAPLIAQMVQNGIPVTAHIGSRPQLIKSTGGFRSTGKKPQEAAMILHSAQAMIESGASLLLVEAVPAEVGLAITELGEAHDVPVIGCGAGNSCHGHVVVLQDLLGMTDWQPPFVTLVTDIGERITTAASHWRAMVQSGEYLKSDHPYESET